MNKIVREHYPVSKLPEDLRQEFAGLETVRIVIEEETALSGASAINEAERRHEKYVRDLISKEPVEFGAHRGNVTIEEAVARIRALRDEWDD